MEGMSGLIGPAIMVFLAALGGGAALVTHRATFTAFTAEANRRLGKSEEESKELRAKLDAITGRVDTECVKKGDLTQVKSEIIERIKDVEHVMRNDTAKAIGDMRVMLTTMLDRILDKR